MTSPSPHERPTGTRTGPALHFQRVGASIRAHPVVTALAVALAALLALILLWDWNWFRGPVERQVEARTGRSFDIGGDLDVDLGRITTIRAADLTLGNAAWSKRDAMASTDLLEFTVDVPALLTGNVRLPELRLTAPEVWFETGEEPGGNWTFGDGDGPGPDLGDIWIEDGRLNLMQDAYQTSH